MQGYRERIYMTFLDVFGKINKIYQWTFGKNPFSTFCSVSDYLKKNSIFHDFYPPRGGSIRDSVHPLVGWSVGWSVS